MPVCHAGVSENRLYRTLRAAVQIGLFEVVMPKKGEEHVRFKNNKRSALLREGHPNCLKHMVRATAVHLSARLQAACQQLHLSVLCKVSSPAVHAPCGLVTCSAAHSAITPGCAGGRMAGCHERAAWVVVSTP